ncbi:hypothetical protein [Corynebacterium sp. CCM 9204]|uniref:hypothetical protein n=1 Tax=Corynebacterium sp. CCM 9204 TaxID=3057616 RepID=UPI003523E879
MSFQEMSSMLSRLLVAAALIFSVSCSGGHMGLGVDHLSDSGVPTNTFSADEAPVVSGDLSDERLIVVIGNDLSTEVGTVGGDGSVATFASAPQSIQPAILQLTDGAVAVAESSGVTVYGGDLREIMHVAGDITGYITESVTSPDDRGAVFAYAVGDAEYPDRHLIIDIDVDGQTFSATSTSVPVGLTRCSDGRVSWLEARSPADSFDGGELGKEVAVFRITVTADSAPRVDLLPSGPAPVWGYAGCGDTVSWISGDGVGVTVRNGQISRDRVDTFRSMEKGADTVVGEGTAPDGSFHRIGGDGRIESYVFTPEPEFHSIRSGISGISGATVGGSGTVGPTGIVWVQDASGGTASVIALDLTGGGCAENLGNVVLPVGKSLLAVVPRGEVGRPCTR